MLLGPQHHILERLGGWKRSLPQARASCPDSHEWDSWPMASAPPSSLRTSTRSEATRQGSTGTGSDTAAFQPPALTAASRNSSDRPASAAVDLVGALRRPFDRVAFAGFAAQPFTSSSFVPLLHVPACESERLARPVPSRGSSGPPRSSGAPGTPRRWCRRRRFAGAGGVEGRFANRQGRADIGCRGGVAARDGAGDRLAFPAFLVASLSTGRRSRGFVAPAAVVGRQRLALLDAPLIVGGREATGTAPATTALGLDRPAVKPAALVAVSGARACGPTSGR